MIDVDISRTGNIGNVSSNQKEIIDTRYNKSVVSAFGQRGLLFFFVLASWIYLMTNAGLLTKECLSTNSSGSSDHEIEHEP